MEGKKKKSGKTNRREGGTNTEDIDRVPQASAEDSCKVCLNRYKETQQRLRVLPCNHNYCSLCSLVGNKIICPTCPKKYWANELPFADAFSPNVRSQMTTSPSEESGGISRFLCTPRDELCKRLVELEMEVHEKRSNLQMNTWKEEHLNQIELLLSCVQKHCEMISWINKENPNVKDASGRADKILQEISTSVGDLNTANTNKKLFLSMENSSFVYDSVQEWNSHTQETYGELIIRSRELREQSRFLLKKGESTEGKASAINHQRPQNMAATSAGGEIDMEMQLTNIKEKIKCLQTNVESLQEQPTQTDRSKANQTVQREKTASLTVSDLKALTPYARSLIASNQVFAVHHREGITRYAQISLDKERHICVHTLRQDLEIPTNAILLQHGDVLGADIRPGETFLDLAAEGRPLGRLRIKLVPYGIFSLNFHRLCTGEEGPSYAQSGVIAVWYRGKDNECATLGALDGEYGKLVVPGVDWEEEYSNWQQIYGLRSWEAGSIGGRGVEEELASIFGIYTKDMKNEVGLLDCYGKVDAEGLDVLNKALFRYCHKRAKQEKNSEYTDANLKKIVIADCGVILPSG